MEPLLGANTPGQSGPENTDG